MCSSDLEAITRRFLVIFEYEAVTNRKPEYAEIVSALETAVQTARQYFLHCDNAVVAHEDENIFLTLSSCEIVFILPINCVTSLVG